MPNSWSRWLQVTIAVCATILLLASCDMGSPRGREGSGQTQPESSPPVSTAMLPNAFRRTVGTAERRCVDVGQATDVRSGEFVAGNFHGYVKEWRPHLGEGRGKLYWIPLHPDQMPGLTVIATRVTGAPARRIYRQREVAFATNGDRFYATGIPLPTRGFWRLLATSGPDWGCFDLRL